MKKYIIPLLTLIVSIIVLFFGNGLLKQKDSKSEINNTYIINNQNDSRVERKYANKDLIKIEQKLKSLEVENEKMKKKISIKNEVTYPVEKQIQTSNKDLTNNEILLSPVSENPRKKTGIIYPSGIKGAKLFEFRKSPYKNLGATAVIIGERVHVKSEKIEGGIKWAEIIYDDETGWIESKYIQKTNK